MRTRREILLGTSALACLALAPAAVGATELKLAHFVAPHAPPTSRFLSGSPQKSQADRRRSHHPRVSGR